MMGAPFGCRESFLFISKNSIIYYSEECKVFPYIIFCQHKKENGKHKTVWGLNLPLSVVCLCHLIINLFEGLDNILRLSIGYHRIHRQG